jgi:hypothetical protein
MNRFFENFIEKDIRLPENVSDILHKNTNFINYNSTQEIIDVVTGDPETSTFEVKYDVPGKGEYVEAVVNRIKNGVAANYTEAYMRRRDPDTMVIVDELPTDKKHFRDKYDFKFTDLQKETFDWLKSQELATFFYFAGRENIGSYGIVIAPANAAFFAMGLSLLQQIVPIDELPVQAKISSAIYVAPIFRHTHFNGRQVVAHNRLDDVHELYSFNLYPGPSAKKGLYGVLLAQGVREDWITAHCSAVQSVSPYDNVTTFMHEGASGGGKSEMHQHILREPDGRILLGKNSVTGEERFITIPRFCSFNPVTDDMAFCHPSIQKGDGKLRITDAENAWFVRVDSVKKYGDDPHLEDITIHPKSPILFLNIDTKPESTGLIWEHIQDEPGQPCPNPRVILSRNDVKNIVNKPVSVDIRSFGLRTPPASKEQPTYGIVGLFHILPPAIAWLWRLVAPRGHNNPSIVGTGKMSSEGVGSYWPFATGKRISHANILLKQILETPRTTFTLVPNQNIGAWQVGFKPQLLMREYLTRRGAAKLRGDQYQAARFPLLGYELNYLTLESSKIPTRFLKVYNQPEVGIEGYDAGAQILQDFFEEQLPKYLDGDLMATGKKIIELCLEKAEIDAYNELIPMRYDYAFNNVEDYENQLV